MISEIFTKELILNSILDSLSILAPIFAPIILSIIWFAVLRYIVSKFVYTFCDTIGYSRKQAKKKSKQAENIMDLFSAYNDISKGGR